MHKILEQQIKKYLKGDTLSIGGGQEFLKAVSDTYSHFEENLKSFEDSGKTCSIGLKEAEERFRQVAEVSDEWIWEVDKDGLYVYSSPAVEKILGYKPEEIVGKKHFYDFFAPDEKEKLKQAVLGVFAKKEVFKGFFNISVHKNGNTVILETNGAPLIDDKGGLCGYRGADRDITERKNMEGALWASKERYRALTENSLFGVAILDTNYKIITVNATFARLFKKSASDFVGKYCFNEFEKRETICVHCPGKLAMVSGKMEEAETQGVRDDGSHFYVRNRAIPFFGPDGVMQGFIEMVEDTDARKKTEERQELLMKDLERMNLAMVGRELKMIELKTEINRLLQKLGMPVKYGDSFLHEED